MKYVRDETHTVSFWNGVRPLPREINVLSYHDSMAEFELLSILCALHGFVTAFDILSGAHEGTEKDTDITAVMTAFQCYIAPKMPLSNYSNTDKRKKLVSERQRLPLSSDSASFM